MRNTRGPLVDKHNWIHGSGLKREQQSVLVKTAGLVFIMLLLLTSLISD